MDDPASFASELPDPSRVTLDDMAKPTTEFRTLFSALEWRRARLRTLRTSSSTTLAAATEAVAARLAADVCHEFGARMLIDVAHDISGSGRRARVRSAFRVVSARSEWLPWITPRVAASRKASLATQRYPTGAATVTRLRLTGDQTIGDLCRMSSSADARLTLLYDLSCAFAARIDLDELVPFVIQQCRTVLQAEGASVLLLDVGRNQLYFPYAIGRDDRVTEQLQTLYFPADSGVAGQVLRTGISVRVDDASSDARFLADIDRLTGSTTRGLLAAPLRGRHGAFGVLEVMNRVDGEPFGQDDLAFLEALGGSVAIALENAQLYAEARQSEELLRAEVGALRRDIARRDRFDEIVGASPAMTAVFRLMESAAASPISVLIEGETGTGKELVARGIHRASERAAHPFIPVNCAALPETLIESELFGHKRGSFTGALQDRRGLFEAAGGGTIFLDEVGEMPAVMQAKLLRVLQEGEIVPVGENRPRKVDVRVISATNRDLRAEIEKRNFREDLFYRLAQFPIHLPPLRERRDDVPLIADRLLAAAARRHRKRIPGVARDALAALTGGDWPGNVRQLQNEIERAVALAVDGEAIGLSHLSRATLDGRAGAGAIDAVLSAHTDGAPAAAAPEALTAGAAAAQRDTSTTDLREAREKFEIAFIVEILRREGGNVTRAAQALGLSRVMLQRKMKDYGLR